MFTNKTLRQRAEQWREEQIMDQTAKMQLVLPQYQVVELNAIERETDRPRARLIRRAVEQFLLRYRTEHPDFARKHPRAVEEIERELKQGLTSDVIIIKGQKREVIITETGYRFVTEDDNVDLSGGVEEPRQMSIIDIPTRD